MTRKATLATMEATDVGVTNPTFLEAASLPSPLFSFLRPLDPLFLLLRHFQSFGFLANCCTHSPLHWVAVLMPCSGLSQCPFLRLPYDGSLVGFSLIKTLASLLYIHQCAALLLPHCAHCTSVPVPNVKCTSSSERGATPSSPAACFQVVHLQPPL